MTHTFSVLVQVTADADTFRDGGYTDLQLLDAVRDEIVSNLEDCGGAPVVILDAHEVK